MYSKQEGRMSVSTHDFSQNLLPAHLHSQQTNFLATGSDMARRPEQKALNDIIYLVLPTDSIALTVSPVRACRFEIVRPSHKRNRKSSTIHSTPTSSAITLSSFVKHIQHASTLFRARKAHHRNRSITHSRF